MSLNEEKPAHIFGFILEPVGKYFAKRSTVRREIASDISISSEWTSIRFQTPLKIQKKFQKISLSLENCRHNISESANKLLFSDETIINPQNDITVEILDEYKNKGLW